MNPPIAVAALSSLVLAGSACAQDPGVRSPATLLEPPSVRLVRDLPMQRRTALIAVPGTRELLLLEPGGAGLEFGRSLDFRSVDGDAFRPAGRFDVWMVGPFTAIAFPGGDVLIAMQTGNAAPQVTVACMRRRAATADFELAGVRAVEWIASRRPGNRDGELSGKFARAATILDWDPERRVAVTAFHDPVDAAGFLVVADVSLSAGPMVLAPRPSTRIEGEWIGVGTDCRAIRIDDELHLFARQPGPGRAAPVRIFVRRDDGWVDAAIGVDGLRVEPEYAVWKDAADRVHLTTPRSAPVESGTERAHESRESVQTLVTYRLVDAPEGRTWQEVPLGPDWSGPMLLGPQLTVVLSEDAPPSLAFHTREREIVVRRLGQ